MDVEGVWEGRGRKKKERSKILKLICREKGGGQTIGYKVCVVKWWSDQARKPERSAFSALSTRSFLPRNKATYERRTGMAGIGKRAGAGHSG